MGIVTGAVTVLLFGLLFLSVYASKIVILFIKFVELIINYAFRTLLTQLIPDEALAPVMRLLGPSVPSAHEMKMTIVDCCTLKLKLEDDDDDEDIFDDLEDAFSYTKNAACCC
eukprot:gb/GFBE01018843.1/.p1 GENE.gb/GFBE01018843.1/~~gb/GFBE01018843.1/.p1  ORF type:complete len:113 (+),score=27.55 gb/GFBE01018843.1/:1-339(+)